MSLEKQELYLKLRDEMVAELNSVFEIKMYGLEATGWKNQLNVAHHFNGVQSYV